MPVSERRVIVRVQAPGFHNWPDAPHAVDYLRSRHRHLFTFRVEWLVDHEERQVEFHIAQGWIREALSRAGTIPIEFGPMSCESIAIALAKELPQKPAAIEIWEDDECGARVEWSR